MAKRGRSIVWIVGLILLGAIGVLWGLNQMGPKPDEIKADFGAKIEALNQIPDEEIVRKDALAEEYLADAQYKNYAKALWLKLEKAHRLLHDAAQLDRAAQKEVPGFLARHADIADYVEVKDLIRVRDEARALLGRFGSSRFGPPLEKLVQRIDAALKMREERRAEKKSSLPEFVPLQRTVLEAVKKDQFFAALESIREFAKNATEDELKPKLKELREYVFRKAHSAAEALLRKVRSLVEEGKTKDAIRQLDAAFPSYEGTPEVAALESYRRTLTPR